MISDEMYNQLGDDERRYMTAKANKIVKPIKNDDDAAEMSQYEFECIEADLRETK